MISQMASRPELGVRSKQHPPANNSPARSNPLGRRAASSSGVNPRAPMALVAPTRPAAPAGPAGPAGPATLGATLDNSASAAALAPARDLSLRCASARSYAADLRLVAAGESDARAARTWTTRLAAAASASFAAAFWAALAFRPRLGRRTA